MSNIINKETLMPLGLVCALVLGAVVMDRRLNTLESTMRANAASYKTQLDAMVVKFDEGTKDRYTKTEAAEKAAREALLNDDQIYVDPRDPDKVLPNRAGLAYMRAKGSTP